MKRRITSSMAPLFPALVLLAAIFFSIRPIFFSNDLSLSIKLTYSFIVLMWLEIHVSMWIYMKKEKQAQRDKRAFREMVSELTTQAEIHILDTYPQDLVTDSKLEYLKLIYCRSCKYILDEPIPKECPGCGKFIISNVIYRIPPKDEKSRRPRKEVWG